MAPYDRSMADDDKTDEKLLVLPLGEESKLITQTIANDTARQILEMLADEAMSTSAIAKKLDIPLTTAQYNVEKLIEAKLVVVEKTKYSEKGREVKLYAPAKRMIVLVPANTPRQAIMDVLKKYLALIPVVGFLALMVELAMQFLNGNLPVGSPSAKREGGETPLAAVQGGNVSADGSADVTAWMIDAKNSTGHYGMSPSDSNIPGSIIGHVTTNDTAGVGANDTWIASSAQNGTLPTDNITGGPEVYTPEMNRSMVTGPDGAAPIPQPAGTSSGNGNGLISPDLLNHYGLWFLVGGLLIIGIMIAYELYRGQKKKR